MSTHPITPDTNPPDQRPEDVPSDKADAKPTPVQPDPSESLAKTLVGNLRAAFQEKDRAALDTLEIAWTAIISRHFEPMAREVEEANRRAVGLTHSVKLPTSNGLGYFYQTDEFGAKLMNQFVADATALRAENERLKKERDEAKTLHGANETLRAIARERDEGLSIVGGYGVCLERANKAEAELAALRARVAELERQAGEAVKDRERLDWLEHNGGYPRGQENQNSTKPHAMRCIDFDWPNGVSLRAAIDAARQSGDGREA